MKSGTKEAEEREKEKRDQKEKLKQRREEKLKGGEEIEKEESIYIMYRYKLPIIL